MKKVKNPFRKGIKKFCNSLISNLNPKCIILYGSLARGDFNQRSDIDIIVISKELPKDYYQRATLLFELIETYDPIEPLGFTPSEFISMIKSRHCTSLFAMNEGIPLYGDDFFNYLKKIHEEVINKYRIVKGHSTWIPQSIE
jgi:predicted nucleotidyltransferase